MSRSYKHTPRSGDIKHRWAKHQANRVVRRQKLKFSFNHRNYKKLYCSYDICDYETVGESFNKYYAKRVSKWNSRGWRYESFPSLREEYLFYQKWFIRK